ncbi:T9SS type A sorting domain-containing protein [Flavobacterium aestuarii]|uniref:T9SS type A sorting domain-containing protein n=1 Tax=Flavobacterium aestuarii TaxID=3149227 RepID=UPI0032B4D0B4
MGGATTEDRTGLTVGTYSVTITDANGCTGTVSPTVTQPATAVSGTTAVTNVVCNAGTTGAIDLTPAGGTAPYAFDWGGGITAEDRTGLTAGTYSVTITDASSCTAIVSGITVTQPAALSGTAAVVNVVCNAGTTGAIDLTPSGGTAPYAFDWGGGITAEDRTGLTAGTYSVTITDASNCTAIVSGITVTQPAALSGTAAVTNVICNAGTTGAIDLTPSGGTAPYAFDWGGGITAEDRTGLTAGTYSVTITDASSCTAIVSGITVTQPAALSGTAAVANVVCNAGTTGAIDLTPAGGTAPYAFDWGGGITAEDRTGLTAGTYSVTITDSNACTAIVSGITVTQPAALSGTAAVTNVVCNAGTTGAIDLTPAGGTAPYAFDWGGGITAEDRTGLTAGTYSVTITDSNACTAIVSGITVTQPAALSGTAAVVNVVCNAGTTGAINLTPSGGTAPYAFDWGGGITAEDRTGLTAGTYSVTITDASSCTAIVSGITVTQPAALSGTAAVANVVCNAGTTGAIDLTPSGGTAPYAFDWGGGITAEDRTGLTAGTYSVTITDSNACTAIVSGITVTQPAALSGTAAVTNVICNAGTTGAIDLTPSGGTAPYAFDWGGGITAEDRTGLTAGTYSVTITDASSCTAIVSGITVTQPAALSGTAAVTNVVCNAGTTGAIDLTPSGGTAPYAFDWGGGITAEDRTGLTAGTYSVTITDASSCTAVVSGITVTQPAALSGTATVTNVICNAGTTGAIDLTPSGGTAPYAFDWGGGITAEDRTGLTAGTYSVTITDSNACTAVVSGITVTQPAALSGTAAVTNVICNAGTTGAIDLTPAGGTAPYAFDWSGGITAEDRTGLTAGTYSVTITDASSCTAIVSGITVTQPAALSGTAAVTNVICNAGTTGAIDLTPAGGTAPYAFDWGGGITAEDRTGLTAGTYSVTITDASSCTAIVSGITVTQPAALSGTAAVTNVICNAGTTGAIDLTPSGGTAPYAFDWGGGITAEDRTGLTAGTYSVTITDSNACTAVVSGITVTQPAALSGTAAVTNVICNAGTTGAIDLTPAGGTAPYAFDWGGGITAEDRTGLTAGTYSVTITDSNACTAIVSGITVTQPAALSGTAAVVNVVCNAGTTGAIDLTPAGGTAPYAFDWGGGITAEDRTGLTAGTYSVTITDASSCTAIVSGITVTQPAALSGTAAVANVICNAGTTGAIDLTPAGGIAPYAFDWGGGITAEDRTGLTAGTYSVTITDSNACTAIVSGITVTQPAALSGTAAVTNVICNAGTTGAIDLTPSGGTAPYAFDWGGGITAEDRTGLTAGTYSVTITDSNACTAVVSGITVTQPAALSGTADVTNVICNAGTTGAIDLTPSGGTAPYAFDWGGGITAEDRTGLTAGTYSVTITDASSCTAIVSGITVTQPAALSGTAAVANVVCNAGTTGAIDLTPAGGTAPYAFDWGGGITAEDRTGLTAGTYSVTITDSNACTAVVSGITVTQPAALSGTAAVANVICNAGTTGAIDLTPAGGTAPYAFDWGGGITAEDRTGLTAGTYSVTITDASSCTAIVSGITVTQPAALSGTAAVANVVCNAGTTGAIDLTPSGGTAPYAFDWGGGITAEDRTGLTAGTYSVTITDSNACTAVVSGITVTQPAALSGTATVTNVICNAGTTGAIDLTPSGGTAPYAFDWGGGITAEDRTGLTAGTYSVTITDSNACTAVVSGITVTQPAALSGTAAVANVICNAGTTGAIDLTPAGGTAPYAFDWSGGITAEDRTGLTAGTYSVTITDASSCTAIVSGITVTQPAALSGTAAVVNVICNAGTTGAIDLTPSGGTAPYAFDWGGGITAEDRTGLTAGTYSVTITDSNACTAIVSGITVTQPAALTGTAAVTNVICNAGTTGAIDLTPSGGTAPYAFDWGGGITAEDRTGLTAGTYSVTITDASNCTAIVSGITVTQPAALSGTAAVTNVICNAGTTGAIDLTPSGGTAPYAFDWGGGITAEDRTGLTAGTYSVTITDSNACTAVVSGITVTQPAAVNATGTQTNVSCNGGSNGSATVFPTGGTPGYTYSWAPSGGTAATATGLVAGTYTVTITDANGCQATQSFTITDSIALAVPAVAITDASCSADGTATVSNYSAGLTYTSAPSGATVDAAGLISGTAGTAYTFTAANASGCTSAASAPATIPVQLTTPAVPAVAITAATCSADGTAAVSNYSAGLTYTSAPAGATVGALGAINGTAGIAYTFTAANASGCTSAASAPVTIPVQLSTPALPAVAITAATCLADGTAAVSNYSAGLTYTSAPSGATVSALGAINGIAGTAYTFTAANASGCTSAASASVTIPVQLATPAIPAVAITAATCLADGTAAVSNYSAGLTYTSAPAGATVDAAGLISGTAGTAYTFTAANASGCTSAATAPVTIPVQLATPAVPAVAITAATCLADGRATVSNFSAGLTYTSAPAGATVGALGAINGTAGIAYTFTAANASGCTSAASAPVTIPVQLATPAVPAVAITDASCSADGTAAVSNYSAGLIYTSAPSGATVDALGAINGTAGIAYTFTAANASGCTSAASAPVTIPMQLATPAVPAVAITAATCSADGIATVSNYSAELTYTSSPAGATVGALGAINGTAGIAYTFTAVNASGCTSAATAPVTIPVQLVVNINNAVTLNSGVLTAAQTGADYQWYNCTGNIPVGSNSEIFTPTQIDDYKVVITLGGCTVTSDCITVSTLGTTDFETTSTLSIYPNPSQGTVYIETETSGEYQVINQLGQIVKTFKIKADVINTIDLQNLNDSMYFIKEVNHAKSKSHKLLIKK